jgi:anti-sigma regulatory factor (Ser/Thr protein kinase)
MVDLAPGLSRSYPATADSLAGARQAVIAVACEAGATRQQIDDVRLAVSEALTNVILHAYRDRGGEIHVTAAVTGGELWVLIADDGGGLRPRSGRSGLGLGLALIALASEGLTIVTRSGAGTELRMWFRLGTGDGPAEDQSRGSVASANSPAASIFSTTA